VAAAGTAVTLVACAGTGGPTAEPEPATDVELVSIPVAAASDAAAGPVQVADREIPNGIYRMTTRGGTVLTVPELQAYARSVLRQVMRPIEDAPYTGKVGLFVTSRASFTATATPGNDIMLPVAVLRQVDTEEELAFVLAHELAHILRRDLQRTEAMAEQDRLGEISRRLSEVALDFGTEIAVTQARDPETARRLQILKRQIKASLRSLQLLIEGGVAPQWTRAQERTADITAIELLHKANYDPLPAQGVFDHLGAEREQRRQQVREHIQRVERLLQELSALSSDTRFEAALKNAGISVGGKLVGEIADAVSGGHDAPAERAKAFSEYLAETYPTEMNVIGGQTERLEATLASPEVKPVLAKLQLARQAASKLAAAQEPGVDAARREQLEASATRLARQAISGRGSDLGYTRMVFHEVREQTGHMRFAELNLTKIADRTEIGPAPRIELAEFYADRGERSSALSVVEGIAARYGSGVAYPLRYKVNRRLGREQKARAALDGCLVEVESRYIRQQCKVLRPDEQATQDSRSASSADSGGADGSILEDAGETLDKAFQ
jgi:hypothetical protein